MEGERWGEIEAGQLCLSESMSEGKVALCKGCYFDGFAGERQMMPEQDLERCDPH